MPNFDDIRPYSDQEVAAVITKVLRDPELIQALMSYRLPRLSRFLPPLSRWLVSRYLQSNFAQIETVRDFQLQMEDYVGRMMKHSTSKFSYSGLDQLDLQKPTLFISNHRDIVLDPALVNWSLHINDSDTLQIAIGDNLLSKPWVADVMRLNKSFIVKRQLESKREKLVASKQLSAYIHHALVDTGSHCWIAQREGRAKDGLDVTNPALVSMLLLNKGKERSLEEYLKQLNIVPVAISYEWDPCDRLKARELAAIAQHGSYKKREHEDVYSINKGITGFKGHIHVAFGSPLSADLADAKAIAAAIDHQIKHHYHLHESNWHAYQLQTGNQEGHAVSAATKAQFTERLEGLSIAEQEQLIAMYANPVHQYLLHLDQ